MPDSVEIPAPVNTVAREQSSIISLSWWISASVSMAWSPFIGRQSLGKDGANDKRAESVSTKISLCAQFRPVAIMLQGLGVGEGFDVLDRTPVNHVADGQFDDLARLGAWNVHDL